jgi:lysophospholipase L1-like esterase
MVQWGALTVLVPMLGLQAQEPPFENEIKAFESVDKINPPKEGGIVFVGSSSIRLWTSLKEDFPQYNTTNRGFGGSQISDSVRNVDRIVTPYKPKAIVFFAGTNDIAAGKTPETVAMDYKSFVERVRAKLPTVPIAFIALTPAPSRWSKIREIRRTNELIRSYSAATPGLRFIDTYPALVNNIGGPRPELFLGDNLHMNPKGYAIWKEIVGPVLKEMVP